MIENLNKKVFASILHAHMCQDKSQVHANQSKLLKQTLPAPIASHKLYNLVALQVLSEELPELFADDEEAASSQSSAIAAAVAFRAVGGNAERLRALTLEQPELFRTSSHRLSGLAHQGSLKR